MLQITACFICEGEIQITLFDLVVSMCLFKACIRTNLKSFSTWGFYLSSNFICITSCPPRDKNDLHLSLVDLICMKRHFSSSIITTCAWLQKHILLNNTIVFVCVSMYAKKSYSLIPYLGVFLYVTHVILRYTSLTVA